MSCHSHARVDNAREPMSSVLETAPPPVHHPRDPPALTDYERRADVTHTANQRPVFGVGETTRPAFGYMSSQLLHGMAKSPTGGGARAPQTSSPRQRRPLHEHPDPERVFMEEFKVGLGLREPRRDATETPR
jgi:hypothetical protein